MPMATSGEQERGPPRRSSAMTRAFGSIRDMWQAPVDKDLYDMASEMNASVNDANIRTRAQAVMAAIGSVVLHERHVSQYAEAHGITIFHIRKAADKRTSWIFGAVNVARSRRQVSGAEPVCDVGEPPPGSGERSGERDRRTSWSPAEGEPPCPTRTKDRSSDRGDRPSRPRVRVRG
jgi:hypothetical protein